MRAIMRVPDHLAAFPWYAPHQAWLRGRGLPCHEPGEAVARRADLSGAYLSGANLGGAYLSGANLGGADLGGAILSRAILSRATLSRADLSSATLSRADLSLADLSGADLRDADLSGLGVPVVADIDSKILAAIESGGTLDMSSWHTCETAHCRAGWAIHLAGEPGHALEAKVGPCAAGALIYAVSRPGRRVPKFMDVSDEEALADIRACASAPPTEWHG